MVCNLVLHPGFNSWAEKSHLARSLASRLISLLGILRAALQLPSRSTPGTNLRTHLVTLSSDLVSGRRNLNIDATALLLARVINRAADDEVWSAAYNLCEPVTPPTTRHFTNSVLDTPFSVSSGALFSTDEGRKNMDETIRREMAGHIYIDLPDFFTRFFDSVTGLGPLVAAVFVERQRTAETQPERWRSFPVSCKESDVAAWFRAEVRGLIELASQERLSREHQLALASRHVVSTPNHPLAGSTAPRKLDIGFVTINERGGEETTCPGNRHRPQFEWRDILVPGELKSCRAKDSNPNICNDLGRYVREVYAAQDNRRFSHGFTLCGDIMRVWRFDRGAIYSAPPFSVNTDRHKFVTVVLGYLLMGEADLGYDTTITKEGDRRYITVGTGERFLIESTMHRQCSIIGRGTTCWKATLEGSDKRFVIKDSWQSEGRADEGELLTASTRERVQNVAPCYHSETVRIGEMIDDLHCNVRKGIDVSSGNRWKERQEHSNTPASKCASSSSVHKRQASRTLENKSQKRSRSNTEGESGNGDTMNRIATNKFHKRIVMSRCGRPVYLANTRLGLLTGLIDGISGWYFRCSCKRFPDAELGHQHLFEEMKILHRDISAGNVLISEDETEGFLIDLDHAIRVDRTEKSGAWGRTGTKIFMSIRLLLHGDSPNQKPHSFMDDLESVFWLLFWICLHISGPGGRGFDEATKYEDWNFQAPEKLGNAKTGIVANEGDFLGRINADFTDYHAPLAPWVNRLRREVFPGGLRWSQEDPDLYRRMKDVLKLALQDPDVKAEWAGAKEAR